MPARPLMQPLSYLCPLLEPDPKQMLSGQVQAAGSPSPGNRAAQRTSPRHTELSMRRLHASPTGLLQPQTQPDAKRQPWVFRPHFCWGKQSSAPLKSCAGTHRMKVKNHPLMGRWMEEAPKRRLKGCSLTMWVPPHSAARRPLAYTAAVVVVVVV